MGCAVAEKTPSEKADAVLQKVQILLGMIPQLSDGPVDDIALIAVKGLLTAIRQMLDKGRSVEEIRKVLVAYTDVPLDRLDIAAIQAKVLADLGLSPADA